MTKAADLAASHASKTAEQPELSLRFHGAAGTVTGSCLEFETSGRTMLVDTGLFQGSRSLEALNHGAFGFDPRKLGAVVLTHAHIDHCGLLPKLAKEGFAGPIWCTPGTADLLPVMLADAAHIQEAEAEHHNRRRDRTGDVRFAPLYTVDDAAAACRLVRTVALEQWFEPTPGYKARLWNAGHILGAASVELEAAGVHILCSGDLGPVNKAFHADPSAPNGFDHVVCESTYGDRPRDQVTILERRSILEEVIRTAIARGGNLIVPVFALERTQELLLDIVMLAATNRIPNVPVFVDSPLANRATKVFSSHIEELEDVGDADIFSSPVIHYVEETAQSIGLNNLSGAIILAASGMCEAGRIRHHLKHNLHRRESTVLFVGFQAQGSLGRVILDGARRVRISGEDIDVKAQIRRIDSYSAHADRDELHDWIRARAPVTGSLFLGHGEAEATRSLAQLVQADDPALHVLAPQIGEKYVLPPSSRARRVQTGLLNAQALTGEDWQNDYADFVSNLRHNLGRIRSDQKRREVLEQMRRVLSGYEDFRSRRASGGSKSKPRG